MNKLVLFAQILFYSVVPLIGVLFFKWDWRELVILFWLENITIGLKAIIAIGRSTISLPEASLKTGLSTQKLSTIAKVGTIGFFVLHYGGFTLVHGIFVFALTSGAFSPESQVVTPLDLTPLLSIWIVATAVQLIRIYRQSVSTLDAKKQFIEPYRRIIPLHLAIIGGAFAITMLNLPAGVAVVLIAIKLFVDIGTYKTIE